MNILDYYVHQGHQYEFFKLKHSFRLIGADGKLPKWNQNHRPRGKNVISEDERTAVGKYDVVIVRATISQARYMRHVQRGAVPVAVIQTTTPFKIDPIVKHVVWNSLDVMNKFKHTMPDKQHHYIVHGFSPDEFTDNKLERNGILTVANVFKRRGKIMGYDLWNSMSDLKPTLLGHGNHDISKDINDANTFQDLINAYNSHSVFFNTTKESAMPRSRGEAAMCGMPIVSTNNYDISRYLSGSAILSNNPVELRQALVNISASKDMQIEYGEKAREAAIKHFHIDDFLNKWNRLLNSL